MKAWLIAGAALGLAALALAAFVVFRPGGPPAVIAASPMRTRSSSASAAGTMPKRA